MWTNPQETFSYNTITVFESFLEVKSGKGENFEIFKWALKIVKSFHRFRL